MTFVLIFFYWIAFLVTGVAIAVNAVTAGRGVAGVWPIAVSAAAGSFAITCRLEPLVAESVPYVLLAALVLGVAAEGLSAWRGAPLTRRDAQRTAANDNEAPFAFAGAAAMSAPAYGLGLAALRAVA
ncbi:MAG: hypothetical protein AAGC56_07020 [Pseudomonadota bacterium]